MVTRLVRNLDFARALDTVVEHDLRHNIADSGKLWIKIVVAVEAVCRWVEPVVAATLDSLTSEPRVLQKTRAMSIACLRVAKMTARLAPVVGKACFAVRRRVEIPTALAHPCIVAVSMVVARGQRAVTGRTLEGRSAVAHGLVVFDKTVTIPVTIWLRACEIAIRTIVVVDTVTCRTHAAPMTSADIVIECPGTRNVAPLTTPTRLTPASKDAADELAGPVPTVATTSRAFTPPIRSIIPLCLALALGIRVTGPMSTAYVAIGSDGLVELLAFCLLFIQCA
ncbi:MAG: hypothetical protein CMJ39_00785 [Phycisphaerae bacterium]|nr:hypothetical protein [Phycisphaerae bacterium]